MIFLLKNNTSSSKNLLVFYPIGPLEDKIGVIYSTEFIKAIVQYVTTTKGLKIWLSGRAFA